MCYCCYVDYNYIAIMFKLIKKSYNISGTMNKIKVTTYFSGQKGFTLIELIISLALVSALGVTFMQGLSTVARG